MMLLRPRQGNQIFIKAGDYKKIQVGNDKEKAQSERNSHYKNRGGKKTKLTIRYLYYETIS